MYNIGKERKRNPKYSKILSERSKMKSLGNYEEARSLLEELRKIPKGDPLDENYKRIKYIRYADDFIVFVIGSYEDCIKLRNLLKTFLHEKCGLTLNEDKTIITLLTKEFTFLGANIRKLRRNVFIIKDKNNKTRVSNNYIMVNAPIDKILDSLKETGIVRRKSDSSYIPWAVTNLIVRSHYEIIRFYNSKLTSILNYYSFATNYSRLGSIL